MDSRSESPIRWKQEASTSASSTAFEIILCEMRVTSWKYTEVYMRERDTIRPSAAVTPPRLRTIRSFTTAMVLIRRSQSMLPWQTPV